MAESRHKYRVVLDTIRQEIEEGRFRVGDRLPSDNDLAERFDASRLTVIRALRELETTGVVKRRAGSGTYIAASGSPAHIHVFGILMPDLGAGEVFEPISQGIVGAAESLHQRVLWGHLAPSDLDKETYAIELCRYFITKRVAGVFLSPVELSRHQAEVNETVVAALTDAGIQIVLVDRCIRAYPERSRYDLVGIDNFRAGYRMTRHLQECGSERVAFAYRSGAAPTVAARMAGFHQAAGPAPTLDIERPEGDPVRFVREHDVDGIVCANDFTAARLMQSLLASGVRIPDQVRMVGINDVKYASLLPVPLTTLRQPCRDIGFTAMSVMLERMARAEQPARDVLLECELVRRASCGPVQAKA